MTATDGHTTIMGHPTTQRNEDDFDRAARDLAHSVPPMDFGSTEAMRIIAGKLRALDIEAAKREARLLAIVRHYRSRRAHRVRPRITWQCSGCRWGFSDPWQRECPVCHRLDYWTGSIAPTAKMWRTKP